MLNVYDKYERPDELPLYNELNSLMHLLRDSTWWVTSMVDQLEPLIPIIIKSPELSFCYAAFVMDYKRFPAGEPVIMKDPDEAYAYARYVLKGRWKDIGKPEVEDVIMQDPHDARLYAQYVIQGRWEDAESVIMTNAESAYHYAKTILKGRWADIGKPEAEEYIKKKRSDWAAYKHLFGIE
jgi:hypothetical protein